MFVAKNTHNDNNGRKIGKKAEDEDYLQTLTCKHAKK